MRKKAILIALSCIIITGCKLNQHCDAYSDQQCDEMYPYYNCDHPQMYSYTPRNYAKHIRNIGNSIFYVGSHYVAPQRVACTVIQELSTPPLNNGNAQLQRSPRPTQLGGDIGLPARKPRKNAPVKRVRD